MCTFVGSVTGAEAHAPLPRTQATLAAAETQNDTCTREPSARKHVTQQRYARGEKLRQTAAESNSVRGLAKDQGLLPCATSK